MDGVNDAIKHNGSAEANILTLFRHKNASSKTPGKHSTAGFVNVLVLTEPQTLILILREHLLHRL